MSEVTEIITESLPDSIESDQLQLTHIKYSFVAGFAIFILLFPFYFSRRSLFGLFDAVAARKVLRFARFFILIEIALVGILFYFYFEYGSPLEDNQQLAYGNGENWLYSYARPTAELVFIAIGLVGELHPAVRWMCLMGCAMAIMSDSFSAYQVRDYYYQVRNFDAPSNGYSDNAFLVYYWRDIIAIGICTTIFMQCSLLMVSTGCCDPQIIHPSFISFKDINRYRSMRQARDRRRLMELRGLLGRNSEDKGMSVKDKSSAVAAVAALRQAAAERSQRNRISNTDDAAATAAAAVEIGTDDHTNNDAGAGLRAASQSLQLLGNHDNETATQNAIDGSIEAPQGAAAVTGVGADVDIEIGSKEDDN